MAVPTNTFTGYTAIGAREDLSNVIHDISPMDRPFMANIPRETASAVFHEWQTDVLATAALDSQIEGNDATAQSATPTVRFGNYTNISWQVPQVTGTLRAVDTAGRADEYSYQIAKRGRQLLRNIETGALGLQAATAGSVGSARVVAGVASWLWDNQVKTSVAANSTASTPIVTSGAPKTAPTAGSTSAMTVEELKTAISNCWDDGGNPELVLTAAVNKKVISAFSGIATNFKDVAGPAPATIIGAADLYISDFGSHQVVADRFMPVGNVYVLDMEMWSIAYLRPVQESVLAKTGDSDKTLILAEWTLVAKNPSSSAKIYTTT